MGKRGLPNDEILAGLDGAALVLQVVDGRGREVLADGSGCRLFELVSGERKGARGSAADLRELTGRRLHWRYGWTVDAESGAIWARGDGL